MYNIVKSGKQFVRLCGYFQSDFSNIRGLTGTKLIARPNSFAKNEKLFCTCSKTDSLESYAEPDIHKITGGDSDLEQKLRVIILEAEVMRQEGRNVASQQSIKDHHWQELLKLGTRTARRRYFEYLFKIEKTKENRIIKKEQKRLEREENKPEPEEDDGSMKYELGKNNMFLRIRDGTINQMYNNRLIQAIQFGQKLVVDCGYDAEMVTRENINCAKQLMLLFAENRAHDDPFDLHYCNASPESPLMKALHRNIATMYEPSFPLYIHQESYLDVFPKNQLVYLTPDCREELVDYDHDAVYIIGAIVDKVNQEPLSLAKAKKEGLKMAKLPLDRYLQWGSGSGKNLTLNQIVSILLDMKHTGDWKHALRHVPKRKLSNVNYRSAIESASSLPYDKNPRSQRKNWRPQQMDTPEKNSNKDRLLRVRNIFND